jgi:hypothetical protein
VKYWVVVFLGGITLGCGNQDDVQFMDAPKQALHSYQTSPIFVPELTGDSLLIFFKEKSICNSLPVTYNPDSLINLTDQANRNIVALPFIKEKYNHTFELGTFAPYCYEFDSIHQIFSFYIYLQSMRNGGAYSAIVLFTCNTQFKNIDYIALAEIYHISPNKGKTTTYQRINQQRFSTIHQRYEIENKENGKGTHYEEKITSTITINNTGIIELAKSDTVRTTKIVRFDC